MNKLAERLKDLREEKGLSMKELGLQLQIAPASICRWENGKADIQATQLIALAKFFGVTTDYLLGLED